MKIFNNTLLNVEQGIIIRASLQLRFQIIYRNANEKSSVDKTSMETCRCRVKVKTHGKSQASLVAERWRVFLVWQPEMHRTWDNG